MLTLSSHRQPWDDPRRLDLELVLRRTCSSSPSFLPIQLTLYVPQIAYKTLPRQQFGNLQSKLFPAYFTLQSLGSAALATLWCVAHKGKKDFNVYLLGGMFAAGLGNLLVVGPWTTGELA